MSRDHNPSSTPVEQTRASAEAEAFQAEHDARLPSAPRMELTPMDPSFDIDDEFLSEGGASVEEPLVAPSPEPSVEREAAPAVEVSLEIDVPDPDPSPVGTALSISELLENGVSVDWQEAVAIARRICDAIARHPSAGSHEYLLDPRHIEITDHGDVRVLPGAPGGDPFVKQVGRILRSLLENGDAPAPLRLLVSQAAFELPGFATVQELSEALRSFDAPREPDAIRSAFMRAREAKYSVAAAVDRSEWVPPSSPALALVPPPPQATWEQTVDKSASRDRRLKLVTAGLLLVLVGIVAVELARRLEGPSAPQTAGAGNVSAPEANIEPQPGARRGDFAPPALSSPPATRSPNTQRAERPARPAAPVRLPSMDASPTASTLPGTNAPLAAVEPEARVADTPLAPSVDESEALRLTFNGLLLANPLYELDSGRATPEAMAALRNSKRMLLPSLARREYDGARKALELGDFDRALSDADRAARIIKDPDFGPVPAALRDAVQRLLTDARTGMAREENRVYTSADDGVVPPSALGRQLPAAAPVGLSAASVGRLEMVIGRAGDVEAVKLHTPLNRYHERMIVSAAKAWRYRPATKDGRPVKFRLFRSVNLPEN